MGIIRKMILILFLMGASGFCLGQDAQSDQSAQPKQGEPSPTTPMESDSTEPVSQKTAAETAAFADAPIQLPAVTDLKKWLSMHPYSDAIFTNTGSIISTTKAPAAKRKPFIRKDRFGKKWGWELWRPAVDILSRKEGKQNPQLATL